MKGKHLKILRLGLFVGLGLLVSSLFIGFDLQPVNAKTINPAKVSSPELLNVSGQMDNTECISCHQQPGMTTTIADTQLSITIDAGMFGGSVHGEQGMACTTCHPSITAFPHPKVEAATARAYSVQYAESCRACHADQFTQVNDSIHQVARDTGNELAPVCTDCHNPHTQTRLKDLKTKTALLEERVSIPQTCSKCHNEIFNQYENSVHGMGMMKDGNVDSPTCTSCHSVHSISAVDNKFRLRSPEVCAECHTDKEMMDKYGLSTNVMSTYVSDFHGTTITIFDKTAPDQLTNKPVCVDCHGVHDMARGDDPKKGLQVKDNLVKTCQKCHPDANENFQASWMSHYIASPTKAPLVYYVNLFYQILIPVVLGGMALYVLSDVIRRQIEKRKGGKNS